MPTSFKYDVFLSYSSKDKLVACEFTERLTKDGLNVWFDEWVLKPGDNIPAKIEEGLEQSRALVLCMSANAFGSDWTQLERQTLRFRDPLNKNRRFFLLRLDDAPIKSCLAQFLYLNWRQPPREQEYPKLLAACRTLKAESKDKHFAGNQEFLKRIQSLGHTDSVMSVAWSADGTRLLSGGEDHTVRVWDAADGRCLRVLEGHIAFVWSVAWSADGTRLLSGGADKTVRMWDATDGRCLRVLEGHTGIVWSVAWSADGMRLLSGGADKTVRVWDATDGRCLRVLEGHTGIVWSVAWSADGTRLLSGGEDHIVRVWDAADGRCLRVLEGHTGIVWSVAWSADGTRLLSGGEDHTVRVWDAADGRCLRVLEGHTGIVWSVAWSADGTRLLSGGADKTVRVWDAADGRCLRVLEGHTASVRSVAWSHDGNYAFSGAANGVLREWDISKLVAEIKTDEGPTQVQYMNAKVLLVGDTGVGKSGLAERLVRRQFIATKSSHARKACVLESKSLSSVDGVAIHQETVLWDLAGQPAYRLVHQLSMEDVALACVLFDNRSERNPFEGAAYWSQVLDQARTSTKVTKILVASRIDVGGLPASRDRIEDFARENGFAQFIPTSANTGEGCDALLEAIWKGIAWDNLPKVTTEGSLAPLRAYIAGLKGEKDGREPVTTKLFTIAQLHEGFSADYGTKIRLEEFISHLERLEATDAVDLLVFRTTGASPLSETLVLLDPTRVDAYASALLVAAKDECDGPGHLLQSRVREAAFKLDPAERIADTEAEKHVLWFVVESLLARDLALSEKIKGEDYFVFPSQCTAELRFPSVASFGVAFGFGGAVRSIYATLIAQLAHFEGFKKREFFQDAATYRPDAGGRCIVRMHDHGRGQGELELSFEAETPPPIRQGFIEFVGKHLKSKCTLGSIMKRHAYHCANKDCHKPFDDALVKTRLENHKKQLLCPYCEEKTPLFDLLATPTAAAESVAAQIGSDAKTGRQRMTAAFVIKAKETENKFDVFLSHNSKDKAAVEKIAKRLLAKGIRPWLDKWHLPPGSTVADELEKAVKTIPCAALCFGPADIGKWHIMEIRAYVERWAAGTARMIPVILPDVKDTPELPMFVRQTLWVDMRDWEKDDHDGFYRLVCGILGRAPGDSPMKKFGVREVAEWQGRKK